MRIVRLSMAETKDPAAPDSTGVTQFAVRNRRFFTGGGTAIVCGHPPVAKRKLLACLWRIAGIAAALLLVSAGYAQVGPAEMRDPVLKAAEQAYLSRMLDVNRAIGRIQFPFSFALSRYAGLSPKEQIGADARGLEFVRFHDRIVLKLTGNYNAAFNAGLLTSNQRANRVFDDVVLPILRLMPEHFSPGDQFDAIGFEIAYHIRTQGRGFEYEGKENLVLVMDKADALGFTGEKDTAKQQGVLNRSEIYLDGRPLGLALGLRDPFDSDALEHSVRSRSMHSAAAEIPPQAVSQHQDAVPAPPYRPATVDIPPMRLPRPQTPPPSMPTQAPAGHADTSSGNNLDSLQKKYQAQIDELAEYGVAKHHFVDYAPPSFVVFRNQITMQLTLKNPSGFDRDGSSIYKRAAQSFDLFLAPQLKPILDKIPDCPELEALDITVIDELAGRSGQSSEALEFVFPLKLLRRFEDFAITNQELIDQSVVLVNGVRIALNLQLVE